MAMGLDQNYNHGENIGRRIKLYGAICRPAGRSVLALAAGAMLVTGCAVTPEPLTKEQLALAAQESLMRIAPDQEQVVAPVGLYEAMARALKYNLDHRVEMMQIALSQTQLKRASASMLPDLVAKSGYADRNNDPGGYSRSLLTGLQSVEPTRSVERDSINADLTFTWHVLDFGLSYVRARQAADKALVAEENKRKVVNGIIEDVRAAYWRAVSAERLLGGFQALRARVERAQANTRTIRRAGQASPLAALAFERELVDIKRQIQRLERELSHAKAELGALMNLRPGTPFKLVVPKRDISRLALRMDTEDMVLTALKNRPEFHEYLYKGRINRKEGDAALLELLPSPAAYAGLNLDSNDLLYNADWVSWGARITWNLARIARYPARRGEIEAQAALLEQQTLATAMAIATQVHVARIRYTHLRKLAATSAEYYNVQRRILRQIKAQVTASAASEQTLIREEMNTLVAAVEFDIAYADLQNAYAAVYASLGIDPVDETVSTAMSVPELAAALEAIWRARGDTSG